MIDVIDIIRMIVRRWVEQIFNKLEELDGSLRTGDFFRGIRSFLPSLDFM